MTIEFHECLGKSINGGTQAWRAWRNCHSTTGAKLSLKSLDLGTCRLNINTLNNTMWILIQFFLAEGDCRIHGCITEYTLKSIRLKPARLLEQLQDRGCSSLCFDVQAMTNPGQMCCTVSYFHTIRTLSHELWISHVGQLHCNPMNRCPSLCCPAAQH